MYKKKFILGTLSLASIFAMIAFFLISPNGIYSIITQNIDLKDENFNGIRLNQSIHHVDHVSKDINNPNFYYSQNEIRMITDHNGDIKKIAITHDTDQTITTIKGITVGDSVDMVKKHYGEDYYTRQEQGVEIMVYEGQNSTLEFWQFNNEVQEIRLSNDEN